MNLPDATNAIMVRLYEWSLRDFRRELAEGGPLLSFIKEHNRTIGGLLLWLPGMSSDDRERLVQASVKLGHQRAVQLESHTITEQERYVRGSLYPKKASLYKSFMPPLAGADRTDPEYRPLDPKACIGKLRELLPTEFGKQKKKPRAIVCTRMFGDWEMVTEFDIRSSYNRFLAYEHRFRRRDAPPDVWLSSRPPPFSLLKLYGLFADTQVSLASEGDCLPMCHALVRFARHFWKDVESLLKGLGIND